MSFIHQGTSSSLRSRLVLLHLHELRIPSIAIPRFGSLTQRSARAALFTELPSVFARQTVEKQSINPVPDTTTNQPCSNQLLRRSKALHFASASKLHSCLRQCGMPTPRAAPRRQPPRLSHAANPTNSRRAPSSRPARRILARPTSQPHLAYELSSCVTTSQAALIFACKRSAAPAVPN